MQANRRLTSASGEHGRTLQRLASGERIVRSGDDAAGMSISEKLKANIRSMQMAARNSQDGISMVQTAEGGVVEAQNILMRLRELSVQAASDTVGPPERSYLDQEFQHLKNEVTRIANTTVYNGTPLLNGTSSPMEFQVGVDNNSFADRIVFETGQANLTALSLGINMGSVETKENALANLSRIDQAMDRVSNFRSYLGAVQSDLHEHTETVNVHRTNLAAANSRMRDADMAEWASTNIQQAIMEESNVSVLAQANTTAKSALSLLEKA